MPPFVSPSPPAVQGPAVTMVRRHARGGEGAQQQHYAPALQTVSGNYIAAKRKGVVGGVDYQMTGVVRFVQTDAVRRQLASGCVVLLSNLGFSAAGEILNCDIFSGQCVGLHSGQQCGLLLPLRRAPAPLLAPPAPLPASPDSSTHPFPLPHPSSCAPLQSRRARRSTWLQTSSLC